MTVDQILFILAAGVVLRLLVKVTQRSPRRWPQIACPTCEGAGGKVRGMWVGFRRRKVRQLCKTCGGSPWSAR